jgi:hypothetical protein
MPAPLRRNQDSNSVSWRAMTPEDLERRKPVWDAMSDMFLDTETRSGMPQIALRLVESGYSVSELDSIWDHEIVPECGWNLLQIAGEWQMFVVDLEALAARADGKRPLLERAMSAAAPLLIGDQWRALKALRAELVAASDDPRLQSQRARMWTAFFDVYFCGSLETVAMLGFHLTALAATQAPESEMLAAFASVQVILASLLHPQERTSQQRRKGDVQVLIARASRCRVVPNRSDSGM